jgi:hypothetical protein
MLGMEPSSFPYTGAHYSLDTPLVPLVSNLRFPQWIKYLLVAMHRPNLLALSLKLALIRNSAATTDSYYYLVTTHALGQVIMRYWIFETYQLY